MEKLRRLAKGVRREALEISLQKLARLDYSDRSLMARRLELVIQELQYIQTVCDARCSIVVEHLEYLRGRDKWT